ncbi:hypothetical protein LX78_02360 [Xanthomarina spongicola]|uniref:Uncharacterized protein n=2 Tax=Xanthomarina spongicola TaxID=570520 RepID=A0A316DIG1_9FLAO|nr:hypothetical protein LX78_02360 [Xanthomarina spongicola]
MKKTLILLLFLFSNIAFCQTKVVKVLNVSYIDYYYVYTAYNYISKDLIVLISSKNDIEFKKILLKTKNYVIETRLKSAIKISEDKYLFCKPNITTIQNIQISDKETLPVLITDYEEIE